MCIEYGVECMGTRTTRRKRFRVSNVWEPFVSLDVKQLRRMLKPRGKQHTSNVLPAADPLYLSGHLLILEIDARTLPLLCFVRRSPVIRLRHDTFQGTAGHGQLLPTTMTTRTRTCRVILVCGVLKRAIRLGEAWRH